ncbi:CGNR zinc finger domain-containing protein [Amycolatopsis sp. YIM 10]|uniref:CGNR zinc finger domain-containing protein n=1 Tax=Amycolatopsis sp. YIM 10 TaxID=2653857 RepID=UPI0012904DBB|nr:CGNR zinc finger domain-containing protein [Amycolatopsis sp. YIM 10]
MNSHEPAAPGSLELVRRFVNTGEFEAGATSAADSESAARLRESLRKAMAANNNGAPIAPHARRVINETAECARLTIELDDEGGWSLKPRATGTAAALGSIVAEMVRAMTTDEWSRLKVCVNDACRRAFYDQSRARSRRWCSMRTCGNQSKQKTWRSRRSAGT